MIFPVLGRLSTVGLLVAALMAGSVVSHGSTAARDSVLTSVYRCYVVHCSVCWEQTTHSKLWLGSTPTRTMLKVQTQPLESVAKDWVMSVWMTATTSSCSA